MPGTVLRTLAVICLSLGGVLCLAQPSPSTTAAGDLGLVVESVARNSMAAKAGLQEGDVLLSWTQGGKSGSLDTTLELARLEIEQGPRGTVTILGSRGAKAKTWQLGDSTWGLKTRPRALESLISSISSVAPGASADAKKNDQQEVLWQKAADQARKQAARPVLISWLLLRAAEALANQGKWDEADAACRQSVQSWPDSESALFPYLLKSCGDAFCLRERGQSRARKYLTQALEAARRQDAASLTVASILSSLGRIDFGLDNLPHAEELLKQALQIQERLVPGTLALAFNLNRLGVFYQYDGKLDDAKVFIGRALELREKLVPGTEVVAVSLENFGDLLDLRGESTEAAGYISRACPLHQKLVPESLLLAGCYADAGTVALDRDDLSQAEEMLRRALALQRKLSPRGGGVFSSLNNLGLVFLERGQFGEAENYFKEALSIKEPGSLDAAIINANLGLVNMERGNLETAKAYLQKSLAIREKLAPGSIETGTIYEHFGSIAMSQNKLQLAEDYLGKALRVNERASPLAVQTSNVHEDLGDLALQKGELARAEKEYSAALSLREKSSPGSWLYADSLLAMARLKRRMGQSDAAARLFQQGLDAVEQQTARLGSSNLVRAGFRARYEQAYKAYIELLIEKKKPELAFEVLERSRARVLLETLMAGRVDVRKGGDPALLRQQLALQADIAGKTTYRLQVLEDKHTEAQISSVDKAIQKLLHRYQILQQQIQASSPAYAALTNPQPITVEQARKLLDADTLLIEYSLGEDWSYAFLVSQNGLQTYELPRREVIENAARAFHKLLSARTLRGPTSSRRRAVLSLTRASSRLSRMILAPLAGKLGGKRLLIACDGALQYVPFAALTDPGSPGSVPLMVHHEIVNLPSASVLATLRQQDSNRQPAGKMIAVLADPVFSAEDSRLQGSSKVSAGARQTRNGLPAGFQGDERLTRSVRDIGLTRLPRLRYTRLEAASIARLVPKSQTLKALDFAASRATALSTHLREYRIIHFATHGILDSEHPELSGLVLSLVDEKGRPLNGFLSLEDIYNMNLSADLVVLSACETGLGKEISGEGMIGLTRGFMYAGAARVVASLWETSDVGTERLMEHFYTLMLREHLPPAAALRKAQIAMWKEPRWSSPYYWAAFELQGEFK